MMAARKVHAPLLVAQIPSSGLASTASAVLLTTREAAHVRPVGMMRKANTVHSNGVLYPYSFGRRIAWYSLGHGVVLRAISRAGTLEPKHDQNPRERLLNDEDARLSRASCAFKNRNPRGEGLCDFYSTYRRAH
jgi:hypothetical protein